MRLDSKTTHARKMIRLVFSAIALDRPMIWTKPSTFVALAIVYFAGCEVEGVETFTFRLIGVFILFLFYKIITFRRQ